MPRGRRPIFPKDGQRVQGWLSKVGTVRFEAARKKLAKLADRNVVGISDGDVFTCLSMGWPAVEAYLKKP